MSVINVGINAEWLLLLLLESECMNGCWVEMFGKTFRPGGGYGALFIQFDVLE